MTYEAWRCTFQSSEQAARQAFKDVEQYYLKNKELNSFLFGLLTCTDCKLCPDAENWILSLKHSLEKQNAK